MSANTSRYHRNFSNRYCCITLTSRSAWFIGSSLSSGKRSFEFLRNRLVIFNTSRNRWPLFNQIHYCWVSDDSGFAQSLIIFFLLSGIKHLWFTIDSWHDWLMLHPLPEEVVAGRNWQLNLPSKTRHQLLSDNQV